MATSTYVPATTLLDESTLSAEALAADLRPYQGQLLAAAQEMLVGCDDLLWLVAAPTSCTIICALGESADRLICCTRERDCKLDLDSKLVPPNSI